MILSASRRTDLPAFYTEWFLHRLREGTVLVRNPHNPRRISRIPLTAETLDGVVFWSKNPAPLLSGPGAEALGWLEERGIPYYLQFTLTPYGKDMEPGLPDKRELVEVFRRISRRCGLGRVVWRYDPIVVGGRYTAEFHKEAYARLTQRLTEYTDECVFSFLDLYAKMRARSAGLADTPVNKEVAGELADFFAEKAKEAGLRLSACCETGLEAFGIGRGACIDTARLERLAGIPLEIGRDPGQREGCGCAQSVDIGAYDTCAHGCVYCYATGTARALQAGLAGHDPLSPLLTGWPGEGDIITERACPSFRRTQLYFTDGEDER